MRISISTKVISLVFCVIFFWGLALGYYVVRYQAHILKLEMDERVTVLMNNLSFNSEYPLLIEDKEAIVRLTKGILAQRDIVFCRIEDESKNFFYEEGSKEAGTTSEYATTIVSKTAAEESGEELILGIPRELEKKIGKVYLRASHSGLKEKLTKAKKIIAATIIPSIIITCLMIYLLLRRFVGLPIKQLVKATEKISQGNLNNKVPVETRDEIGVLAVSFNKMTESLLQTTLSKKEMFIGIIESLSNAIDAKSPWTAGHSQRVTRYAIDIGKELGFAEKELKDLELVGLLHDVGKIGTYENILNKPGKLADEELKMIRQHPSKGVEILSPIKHLKDIIPAIKYHHEFYNGTGYPEGIKGEAIPIFAKILSVADTVDAMLSDRPYRKGKSMDEVLAELKRCSGTQFDPKVVEAFLALNRNGK